MRLTDYLDFRAADVSRAQPLDEHSIPEEMRVLLRQSVYVHHGWDTQKVTANTIDERIRSLCQFYRVSPVDRQRSMRAAVTIDGASTLLCFALRSAIFTLRSERREEARENLFGGIVAIALANLANQDPRDDITILHKLYSAGVHSGVDSLAALRRALQYCGSGVSQIIAIYFLSRSRESVGEGFSFDVIHTPYGPSTTYL